MKKWVCAALALMIVTLGIFPVSAEETTDTVNLTEAHAFETATSLCFIEDTLYMLGAYGIYVYRDNALTTLVDLSDAYMYRYQQQRSDDENGAAAWEKVVSRLFTDGKALYGLHPYTGQVFEIAGGQLSAYAQIPEGLLYAAEEDFFREIKGVAYVEEKLILLLGTDIYDDYEKTEVVFVDLKAQTCQVSNMENVQSIAAGADGKLLIYTDAEEAAIWQVDVGTNALEKQLAQLEPGVSPGGMVSYQQSVVYLDGGKVKRMDENGTPVVKAYMPVQYASMSEPAACSKNGLYAYPYSNYVFLRDVGLDGEASQTVLTLMGNISPQLMIDFSIQNPDIAVVVTESMNPNELVQAAVSGDDSVDLFVLSAPGTFYPMKGKGYLAALNENAGLLEEARTLYPAMQEVVFDGDLLLGYPMSVSPMAWMVNETQWKALNLGAYPATYEELFEKVELWLDEYAMDYPEYTLSDFQQTGLNELVLSMVEAYIRMNETSAGQLSFDTPSFRALLKNVADHADLFAEENEQWGMPLLNSMYLGFGTCYTDRDLNRMILAPTVDSDADQSLYADVDILAVSAASEHTGEAARFIEFCVAHLSNTARYEMKPALNDPVESSTYHSRVADLREELNELTGQLEHAEQEKHDALEERILGVKATLDQMEAHKWEISPESIAIYREAAKDLKVSYTSPLLLKGEAGGYDSLRVVVNKYCTQAFDESDVDALIRELDRVATMVELEGN